MLSHCTKIVYIKRSFLFFYKCFRFLDNSVGKLLIILSIFALMSCFKCVEIISPTGGCYRLNRSYLKKERSSAYKCVSQRVLTKRKIITMRRAGKMKPCRMGSEYSTINDSLCKTMTHNS